MAGSGDLAGGRYPLGYSFAKAVGLASNATQTNLSVRSNVEWFGYAALTAAAAITSGDMTLVPVPVEIGDEIATVAVPVVAAASTPTHSWAQLYSGVLTTALPIATQSTDGGTGVIAASGLFTFTLGAAAIITPAMAPYGYIYVGISETGTTPSTLSSWTVATGAQYARFVDAPPFFSATYSSALGATAPTSVTLASASAQQYVPEVYLY